MNISAYVRNYRQAKSVRVRLPSIAKLDVLFCDTYRYDVREGRPVLKAYMDRVISDLSPEYDDAHKIVRMMVKKFGGKIPGR